MWIVFQVLKGNHQNLKFLTGLRVCYRAVANSIASLRIGQMTWHLASRSKWQLIELALANETNSEYK